MESQLIGMHVQTVADLPRKGIVRHVAYAITGYEGCIDERVTVIIELTETGRFLRCRVDQFQRDLDFYEGEDADSST